MTISPPIRIAAAVGVLLAAILAFFMLQHRSTSGSAAPSVPTISKPHRTTVTPTHATPAKPHRVTKPAPAIVLLPDLPKSVAHALRYSKVVVVSLYARGGTGDADAVAAAALGAHAVHAGFLPVDLANERAAVGIGPFAGTTTSPPTVLVVRRPGRIVNRFDGFVDSDVVAQAAQNAGAHK